MIGYDSHQSLEVQYYIGNCEELSGLAANPLERINLAADSSHGAQKEALKSRLLEWLLTASHKSPQ